MILLIVRAVFYISFQVSGTDVILKSYMAKLRWGNSQKSTLYERIIKFILKKKRKKTRLSSYKTSKAKSQGRVYSSSTNHNILFQVYYEKQRCPYCLKPTRLLHANSIGIASIIVTYLCFRSHTPLPCTLIRV